MTGVAAAASAAGSGPSSRLAGLRRILLLAVVPLPVLAAIAASLYTDPILSTAAAHALSGDAGAALAATRETGLWGQWLWASRNWPLGLDTLIWLFYGGWVLYAACLAQAVFRGDPAPGRALAFALALALAPPVADLAPVLPAAVPAVLLLALHAALVLVMSARWAQLLLLVVVPLVLLTEARLAMVPLATQLVGASARHGKDGAGEAEDGASLAQTLALFIAGCTAGMLAIFALNHWQHGIFGLERAFAAPPAEGEDRLALIGEWLGFLGGYLFGPMALLGLAASLAAIAALYWLDPRQADRIFGALVLGLLLLFGQALLSGAPPSRPGLLFVWVLVTGALACAARAASGRALSAAFAIGLLAAAAAGGLRWHQVHAPGAALAAGVRGLEAEIRAEIAAGGQPRLVALGGVPSEIPGGVGLREFGQLALTLGARLGIPAVQCPGAAPVCTGHGGRLATQPARPAEGWLARTGDGVLLVRLPDGVFIPARER